MLKINRETKTLHSLSAKKLCDASILERSDLQEFIANSPTEFFVGINEELKLFVVDKEVPASDDVGDRIDLLCLDREGAAVIVELKRDQHKLQLLQAITYAAMVAKWESDDFTSDLTPVKKEELAEFLDPVDFADINRRQRILLVAEGFDYSVLITAEWLATEYGVDIMCCKVSLVCDESTGSEYLVCSSIFPNPDVTQHATARGKKRKDPSGLPWSDWEQALAAVQNPAIVDFYRSELDKRENYLRNRGLRYRVNGKRRLFLGARRKHAYCWQEGRFADDVDFWTKGLSKPETIEPVKQNTRLRFHLETKEDFEFFRKMWEAELPKKVWDESISDEDGDDDHALDGG